MVSYEVRMSDSVENTGLDGQFFATREEAQMAADLVNAEFERAHAEVVLSKESPTLTFADWNARGW